MFRPTIFVILSLLSIQFGANYALKFGLEKLFSSKTDCIVTLEHTWVNFFLQRGTARNVSFECAGRLEQERLSVNEISVLINLTPLLAKRVVLPELVLVDTQIASLQQDSGFNRLMQFLFTPPIENGEDWHAFISEGWSVEVGNVNILSTQAADASVVLQYPGILIKARNAKFDVIGTPKGEPSPVRLAARDLSIRFPDADNISYSFVQAKVSGELAKGIVQVDSAELKMKSPDKSSDFALDLKTTVRYANGVVIEGKVSGEGNPQLLFPPANQPALLQKITKGSFAVSGELALEEQTKSGQFFVELNIPQAVALSEMLDCQIPQLQMTVAVNDQEIEITQGASQSLLRDGKFVVKGNAINGSIALIVPASEKLSQYCSYRDNEAAKSDAVVEFIEKSLSDSVVQAKLSGTLDPLDLQILADANLRSATLSDSTTLKTKTKISEARLEFEFNEKGEFARLQPVAADSQSGTAAQTLFNVVGDSALSGKLDYRYADESISLSKLKAVNFPLSVLWYRAQPFLPAELLTQGYEEALATGLTSFEGAMNIEQQSVKDGNFDIEVREVMAQRIGSSTLQLETQLSKENVRFENIVATMNSGSLKGFGETTWDGKGKFHFEAIDVALSEIKVLADGLPGLSAAASGEFDATLALPAFSWNANAVIDARDLWKDKALPQSKIKLAATPSGLAGEGSFFGEQLSFSAKRIEDSDASVELVATAKKFPMRYLLRVQQEQQPLLDNLLSATLQYKFQLADLFGGDGVLQVDQIQRPRGEKIIPIELSDAQKPKLLLQQGDVVLQQFAFTNKDKKIAVTGALNVDSGWNVKVKGNWDLSTMAPLRQLEQLSGDLLIDAGVRGPIDQPAIDGTITLSDGRVSFLLNDQFVGAEDVSITAKLQNDQISFNPIQANIGAGTVEGQAVVREVFDKYERSSELQLTFNDVYLEPVEDFTTMVSGTLGFNEKALGSCAVNGEIQLAQGLYQSALDLRTLLKKTSSALLGSRRSGATQSASSESQPAPCDIAVSLKANSGILVETPLLVAEAKGELNLAATAGEMVKIEGLVEAIGGTLGMRTNQFEIVHGSLIFRPERLDADPLLDILAETNVRTAEGEEALVQMVVRGSANEPQISFTSDYGLSEREIVSLLGFGASIRNVSLFGNTAATDRSVGSLLNPISDVSLSERLAGLSGFSEVQIDSVVSARTGDTVPRFSVQRRIVGTLNAELSTELGVIQESFAKLEFPLTPYLNLIGGWKSEPITRNIDTASGSLNAGFEYNTTFPGTSIFPEELPW